MVDDPERGKRGLEHFAQRGQQSRRRPFERAGRGKNLGDAIERSPTTLDTVPFREIAQEAGEQGRIDAGDARDRELDGKLHPIRAQRGDLDPPAKGRALAGLEIALDTFEVGFSKSRRYDQIGEELAARRRAGKAEDALRGGVEFHHAAVVIDGNDRVERGVEHRASAVDDVGRHISMVAGELDDRGIVTVCPGCGQKNRLAYGRLGDPSRCGQCKRELPPPSAPVEVARSADFDRLVASASVPVVVDYWAPWCGPCRMVAPELQKVAARQAGRMLIVKVNTDVLADLGERFQIRSIPTLAVFAGGREIARTAGARPAPEIEAFIANAVSSVGTRERETHA